MAKKGEWHHNMHPIEGDTGWGVYYKRPIYFGRYKGMMSDWKAAGFTHSNIGVAKQKAASLPFGHVLVRKVKFTNHARHPMKLRYQRLSGKWVKQG